MPRTSAGLLMFRRKPELQVLLVHPGGPFWAKKDAGAWSLPKGEFVAPEDPLEAAKREFQEELGFAASGEFLPLGEVKQAGGKIVQAWAFEGDCDPATCKSNTFEMEWPPRSGRKAAFPEVDRAEFFSIEAARLKINASQVAFLDRLQAIQRS